MQSPHWSWGLSTALVLALVIWLNGRQIRFGWLLGAVVQLINYTFGWLIYGQWTFTFLLIPAGMFVINWWRHPRRVKPSLVTVPVRDLTPDEVAEFVKRWEETGVLSPGKRSVINPPPEALERHV